MARRFSALATVLALSATVGMALPAVAAPTAKRARQAARARLNANHAYRVGFNRGFRAGQANVAREVTAGQPGLAQPAYGQVAYGQAAYGPGVYSGPFNNGGVLGTGVLNGQGVLGTGVFGGQGALGIGILGF